MVRHIANIIAVQIIAFIFVPIISVEIIYYQCAVRSNIKSVSGEIILRNGIVDAARRNFDGPSVVFKFVEIISVKISSPLR